MPSYADLAGVWVGEGFPVRIMGAINVSPESFYKGSVVTTPGEAAERAVRMVEEGADFIDIGGMSTAPYLQTEISVEEERRRAVGAVRAVKESVEVPVSIDTRRAVVAEAAVEAGADLLNDVSRFKGDPGMLRVIRDHDLPVVILAHEERPVRGGPIERVLAALHESLLMAEGAGVGVEGIVVDPSIGFFRGKRVQTEAGGGEEIPWYVWDCRVIRELGRLRELGRPVCIALSRKSFIGELLGLERPEDRLIGSIASTAIAVFTGYVHMVRTHDVAPTLQAVRMAEALLRGGRT